MSKELLFVLALIICVVLTFFYQKKVQEDLLKKLYVYKANHDQEGFMNTLDSSYTRFVFSKFTIEFMKLNYYLDHHDYLQAKEQFKKWNEVLDYIIPILIKGAEIDPQTAKCGFVLTRDMWWNNEFIVYVVKRLAGKYGIDMEG